MKNVLSLFIIIGLLFSGCSSQPHQVLCLGNSMTLHAPNENVGWFSDWGMAASCRENDYCHILDKELKQRNKNSSVTPLNIAFWERNPYCNIDSLICRYLDGKDMVIIRLGENVRDIEAFRERIQDLIEVCLKQTSNVIVTGCFWPDAEKDAILKEAALSNKLPFIPLDWILMEHEDIAYPSRDESICGLDGTPYKLTNTEVLRHPGDEGMRMIAESIMQAI